METAFLPSGEQIAWDATSLDKFKKCPRAYQLGILLGYRNEGRKLDIEWGKAIHNALEVYYKKRHELEEMLAEDGHAEETTYVPHELALNAAIREALECSGTRGDDGVFYPWEEDFQDNNKSRYTLIRAVVWYCDDVAKNDSLKTHIMEDGTPAVELSWRIHLPIKHEASGQPYILCGHIDRIGEMGHAIYPIDYKSTRGTVNTSYFERFDPNGQMYTYSVGADIILGRPSMGVMVDGIQAGVHFNRFGRQPIVIGQDQKQEWLHETYYWIKKAEECAVTYGVDGSVPWPKNDTSCFLCDFKRVCNKSPGTRQAFLDRDFYIKKWDCLDVRK